MNGFEEPATQTHHDGAGNLIPQTVGIDHGAALPSFDHAADTNVSVDDFDFDTGGYAAAFLDSSSDAVASRR